MDEYTTVEARVTKQEDTSSRRSASCRLHVSYAVSDQQLHGVAGVNAGCGTLPGVGFPVALNVSTSDPLDIWVDGADDSNHPDPVVFGALLPFAALACLLCFWGDLTDFGRTRKLLASGAQWRTVQATVTGKAGNGSALAVHLEAEDVDGRPRSFSIVYRFFNPIGPVRKGDTVELTLLADGRLQALLWRPDQQRIRLIHVAQPPARHYLAEQQT
ncbi:hypothetical protein [Paenarthrobacter sp. NPDC018779]|uniref:hypothetical protein n=1 Tax=Paenarthrobacter sp. NPDC018779 TaxID=3364375 RepID=UPI0037C56BC0